MDRSVRRSRVAIEAIETSGLSFGTDKAKLDHHCLGGREPEVLASMRLLVEQT
jgi:hypothetical protein